MPTLEILRPEAFAPLVVFAFSTSITPGPNNMMLMASGANFGLKRTLPHWAGVVVGFTILLLATGLGLGALFAAFPVLHEILKWAGAAYLLWLAFKIATSTKLANGTSTGKPMSFLAAVAFQAVNVKAWSMAIGAATAYVPAGHYFGNLVVASLVFAGTNAPCVASWLVFGIAMRRFLEDEKKLRVFNWVMAGLLVLSLIPILH